MVVVFLSKSEHLSSALGRARSVWVAMLVVKTLTATAYDFHAATRLEVSTGFLASLKKTGGLFNTFTCCTCFSTFNHGHSSEKVKCWPLQLTRDISF